MPIDETGVTKNPLAARGIVGARILSVLAWLVGVLLVLIGGAAFSSHLHFNLNYEQSGVVHGIRQQALAVSLLAIGVYFIAMGWGLWRMLSFAPVLLMIAGATFAVLSGFAFIPPVTHTDIAIAIGTFIFGVLAVWYGWWLRRVKKSVPLDARRD